MKTTILIAALFFVSSVTVIAETTVGKGKFGNSVSGVSDIDGDGVPDIAVGDEGRGQVHIFSGTDGSIIRTLTDPNKPNTDINISDIPVPVIGDRLRPLN